MARPSKLTPDVQRRICEAIRAGNYYEASCAYAGVDYSTFRLWMVQGETAKTGRFFELFESVLKAEADAEVSIVAQWKKQIPEDWRAARDFLARRYSARWGPTEKHELTGKDGAALQTAIVNIYIPSNGRDDDDQADS